MTKQDDTHPAQLGTFDWGWTFVTGIVIVAIAAILLWAQPAKADDGAPPQAPPIAPAGAELIGYVWRDRGGYTFMTPADPPKEGKPAEAPKGPLTPIPKQMPAQAPPLFPPAPPTQLPYPPVAGQQPVYPSQPIYGQPIYGNQPIYGSNCGVATTYAAPMAYATTTQIEYPLAAAALIQSNAPRRGPIKNLLSGLCSGGGLFGGGGFGSGCGQ